MILQKGQTAQALNIIIMWKNNLITLYCTVCKYYNSLLQVKTQSLNNNCRPQFTDEEIITVYLWGIMQRQFEVKAIYHYRMHLLDWLPKLPSYQAFSRRLCELAPAFESLAGELISALFNYGVSNADLLIDSMPVVVSKGRRSSSAKVARILCSYLDHPLPTHYSLFRPPMPNATARNAG